MVELIFSARTQAIDAYVSLSVDGVRGFRICCDIQLYFFGARNTVDFAYEPTKYLKSMVVKNLHSFSDLTTSKTQVEWTLNTSNRLARLYTSLIYVHNKPFSADRESLTSRLYNSYVV